METKSTQVDTRPVLLIFLFMWKAASKTSHLRSNIRETGHMSAWALFVSKVCLSHSFIFLFFINSYIYDICYIQFHENEPKSSVISRILDNNVFLRRLRKVVVCDCSYNNFRDGSRTTATSQMEFFVTLANHWRPLTQRLCLRCYGGPRY